MIRVAAVGDVHMAADARGSLHDAFATLPEHADVLLLAGDLTRTGTEDELQVLLDELDAACIAAIRGARQPRLRVRLRRCTREVARGQWRARARGRHRHVRVDGETLGIAGTKGFGGGFAGACGSDFGEPEMKAFVQHTRDLSDALGRALGSLDTDVRVALTHFAPVKDTLGAERLEIYPFLGATCSAKPSTAPAPTSRCTATRTTAPRRASPRVGSRCATWRSPCSRAAYAVYCLGA